jgi:serine/threonine protein kinase
MSSVYRAVARATGEAVALKILSTNHRDDERIVKRFFRELDLGNRISHCSVLRLVGRGCTGTGLPYLSMELLDGTCLASHAVAGIEVGAIAAIGGQIADAIATMAAGGLAHCDLKPDNVVVLRRNGVTGWPEIKIVDFGVARLLDGTAALPEGVRA